MKKLYWFIIRSMLCVSLFLILGILCRSNLEYKEFIYNKLYEDYLDFSTIRNFYDKYLGGVLPIDNIYKGGLKAVFNESLVYKDKVKYGEGVSLVVDYNYLVPIIEDGVVVYVGNKNKYGKVVIIEGSKGIDIWYGNMDNVMVNIYDNVSKGEYLGNVIDNKLYLVYSNGNEFLDYNDYLS